MASIQTATVVIACPHCGTRYQVPPETLGERGRTVSCAHCGKAWLAERPAPAPAAPDDDRLFTPSEEEALDRQFVAVEKRGELAAVPSALRKLMPPDQAPPPEVVKSIAEIKAAIAPRVPEPPAPAKAAEPKPAAKTSTKADQPHGSALKRLYPVVRGGAVVVLIALVGGLILFRTEIVRALPDMAGIYAAVGLPVNVVGLEFSDVTTLVTRLGDGSALVVSAKIRSVNSRRTAIPPIVATLLDEHGVAVYEWSVTSPAPDVAPGEVVELSAELAAPPEGARELRLSFAEGGRMAATPPAQPQLSHTDSVEETH
jgi:predicted Zn finger-like uncharacterized protein